MASHSLPVHNKQKHRPAVLPLGPASTTSLSAAPTGTPRSPTFSTSTPAGRPLSAISGTSHGHNHAPGSSMSMRYHFHHEPMGSSPTLSSFPASISMGTTHAGGIQPSASFFRPSRPSHFDPTPRPASQMSTVSSNGIHAPETDIYQLAPLTKQPSNSSGEEVSDGAEDTLRKQVSASSKPKRLKHSREPLLPIGGSSSIRRPPTSTSNSSMYPAGTGRRVRNSLERVFRRGLSMETVRRSTGSLGLDASSPTVDPVPFKHASTPPLAHTPTPTFSRQPSPSPSQQFISLPPSQPLWSVPLASGARNHTIHASRNRFFLGGRLLTGGDAPAAFIGSLVLALALGGIWLGTTVVWWTHEESLAVAVVGAYMVALTLSTMFATALKDPGILPRDLDPDPPYPSTSPLDDGIRAPLPRDLKVRSDVVRVKYCPTCKTYRPPRSSHCKMCDNCVDGCDHHCQWVNNCVGRRNYTSFFAFLLSATLTLCLIIVTSALHIYLLTRREHLEIKRALGRAWGSSVSFALAVLVIWPMAALLSYHMRLLFLNITTIEQIRNQAHKTVVPGPAPPNPFSHGSWRRNMMAVLCRPAGYSWIDARAQVTEDRREVNPGLVRGGGWDGEV